MLTQTVALYDVKFYAFHGFYPEEQLTGNHFLVSAEVTFEPSGDTENIDHTVNYEVLNDMIMKEMQLTQKMLETVVKRIIDRITIAYPFVQTATVGIKKLNPLMLGEVGMSFVELSYSKH